MYAVIEDSGSQRRVSEGDVVLIDLVEAGQATARGEGDAEGD